MVDAPSSYKANLMNVLRRTSKEEMDHFKQMFDLFDKDGDGLIDSKELTSVLKVLDVKVTERDIKELIADVDIGNTGSISLEGFVFLLKTPVEHMSPTLEDDSGPRRMSISGNRHTNEYYNGITSNGKRRTSIAGPSSIASPNSPSISTPTKKFGGSLFGALGLKKTVRTGGVYDSSALQSSPPSTPSRNRRATIGGASSSPSKTRLRYNQAAIPMQQPSPKTQVKSGFSFLNIFQKGRARPSTIEPPITERIIVGSDDHSYSDGADEDDMRQVFKVFDLDGDGLVSVSEVLSVMQKLGLGVVMADEEVRTLFSLVDSDRDGRISFSEFCTLFSMPS